MKATPRFYYCLALMAVALIVSGCPSSQPTRLEPVAGRTAAPEIPAEICPPQMAGVPEPAWQPITGKMVIIDAGHGGKDHGASHYGMLEKDINLDLAKRTAASLRAKGVAVVMTRETDAFISLPDRSAVANKSSNAVFVSIHVNASTANPNATGVETFVYSGASDAERGHMAASKFKLANSDPVQSRQALANLAAQCRTRGTALAEAVQKSVATRMATPDRGIKPGNLAVLRETYFCPAVLVEVGFLTNPSTAMAMRTDDWRRRTAEALADGIADFLRQP